MIFVTVGTHEQPFNRLIRAVDDMKKMVILETMYLYKLDLVHMSQSIVNGINGFHMIL